MYVFLNLPEKHIFFLLEALNAMMAGHERNLNVEQSSLALMNAVVFFRIY